MARAAAWCSAFVEGQLLLPAYDGAPVGWRPAPLRAAMMGFPARLMALAGRAAQVRE
jgi:hypothetical protein